MKNPDPEGEFKDRGRRKAIVLCRADYAPENRENILLMLSTLHLLPRIKKMGIKYEFIGDMKVQAALLGEYITMYFFSFFSFLTFFLGGRGGLITYIHTYGQVCCH